MTPFRTVSSFPAIISRSLDFFTRGNQNGRVWQCQGYAGGCIGWAPGAALGVKLVWPDKTVVSLMGDGAFVYGCPEASLWSAGFYEAPFFAVIYDNQGYGSIKGLFREKHDVDNMGADIPTPPDYTRIARACNSYGRRIEDPSEVVPALKEALGEVNRGKPAVLDVRIEPV